MGGAIGYFKVAPAAAQNGLKYNIFNGKYTPLVAQASSSVGSATSLSQSNIKLTVENPQTGVYEQMEINGNVNPKLGNHTDFLVTDKSPKEVFDFLTKGNAIQQPNGSWIYQPNNGLRIDFYQGSSSGFNYTIQLRFSGSGTYLKLRWY